MLNRFFIFLSLLAGAILAAMLFFTTPAGVGPVGILLFFILTYVVMLGVVLLLVRIFVRLVYKRKKMNWRDCANGAVLAFWPVMILVFISLGASNVIFSAIGATISVILILFLIRKV
jgi:hypothetical protein